MTIGDAIRSLMPNGTKPSKKGMKRFDLDPDWKNCPGDPSDLFGVVAYLAEKSGLYAILGNAVNADEATFDEKQEHLKDVQEWAQEWTQSEFQIVPKKIQDIWLNLLEKYGHHPVVDEDTRGKPAWHKIVLNLMAVADEASTGLGFLLSSTSDVTRPENKVLVKQIQYFNQGERAFDPQERNSMCRLIKSDQLCVMPKALTTTVGCTLRSLTHHLALLPGRGVVKTQWHVVAENSFYTIAPDGYQRTAQNVLIIPFPYVIRGGDFYASQDPKPAKRDGYFSIRQEWLPKKETLRLLTALVVELIQQAELEVDKVHQIVFPECALTAELTKSLAIELGRKFSKLECLIAGTLDPDPSNVSRIKANNATIVELIDGRVAAQFSQRKHHRWKLTASQIETYGLAHVLDPEYDWWEETSVQQRRVHFVLNHRNWVRTVLVCEDLARFDPVLPVINAVGPNMVIALLLDGPQLTNRWPARYATVLSEDPGSSILTLTSAGMVDRALRPGFPRRRIIGLWKDGAGPAREIELPDDAYALVLTLTEHMQTQRTMDGRTDRGTATQLRLSAINPVRLVKKHDWIHRQT